MPKSLFRYRVIIPYSEPTYLTHRENPLAEPYYATYNVAAANKKAAVKCALDLFEQDARNSSVHWIRVPYTKKIKVELLSEEGLPRETAKIINLKTQKEKQ